MKPIPDLGTLLQTLAVSGRFDPIALLARLPADDGRDLAASLSTLCEEVIDEHGAHWSLRASVRREQLATIRSRTELDAAIHRAPRIGADADFVTALRDILRGRWRPANVADVETSADLAARDAALQFAQHSPLVDAGRLEAFARTTKARIATDRRDAELALVLPNKLFGRETYLRRIVRYATSIEPDPPAMLIEGIGGIGKSALVAAAIGRCSGRRIPAILLDFDRVELAAKTPFATTRQVLKQLETIWTAHKGAEFAAALTYLQRVRGDLDRRINESSAAIDDEQELEYVFSGVFSRLKAEVDPEVLGLPMILVLDSFEVVGVAGFDIADRIMRLALQLRVEAGFERLRLFVGCRQCPLPETAPVDRPDALSAPDVFGPVDRRLKCGGISPKAGAELLAARDTAGRFPDRSERESAALALRGNPLALIALERFGRSRTRPQIVRILKDIANDPAFNAEMAQSFLYTRILDRIADPEARAIAHPGLVLRQVTPDLIRLVLAKRCGLANVDGQRALLLLNRLAGEYWLVQRDGAERLRHRTDMRVQLVNGMLAGPTDSDSKSQRARKLSLREQAIAVCRAAVRYYAKGPAKDDPGYARWQEMAPADRAMEANYYRALSGVRAPRNWTPEQAGRFEAYLGAELDMATLPPAWRGAVAILKGDSNSMLANVERAALRGDLRRKADLAAQKQINKHSMSAGPMHVKDLSNMRTFASRKPAPKTNVSIAEIEQTVLATFNRCEWQICADMGSQLFDTLNDKRQVEEIMVRTRSSGGAAWHQPLWRAALVMLAERRDLPQPPDSVADLDFPATPIFSLLSSLNPASRIYPRLQRQFSDGIDSLRCVVPMLRHGKPEPFQIRPSALSLLSQIRDAEDGMPFDSLKTDEGWPASSNGFDRMTLANIEEYYSSADAPVWMTPTKSYASVDDRRRLRGLTPELYAPLANLLTNGSNQKVLQVTEFIAITAPFWPLDLWFEGAGPRRDGAFGRRPFNQTAARSFVQTADRCGLLPELTYQMSGDFPESQGASRILREISSRLFDIEAT